MINKLKCSCHVCNSENHDYYISTRALMHKSNMEEYRFHKCNVCQAVFLTNPVSEEHLDNYYTDNYLPYQGSGAWGKYRSFVERSQVQLDTRRVNFVGKWLDQKDTQTQMLDVGCGNPSFLDLASKKLNITCTGIDFSDSGWRDKNYTHLNLMKVSMDNFQPMERYDVITLWHYLEHDYHPQATIEKLYNCLKPGGKLIIEVPDYKSITAKLQKSYWQGWHSPRHLTLFSLVSFTELFQKPKWEIVKHLRYGTMDAFTLSWLGIMEKKGINWAGNMEPEFWPLVFLKILTVPIFIFEKYLPLGIQTLVVEKKI